MHCRSFRFALLAALALAVAANAADEKPRADGATPTRPKPKGDRAAPERSKPDPDIADAAYGPHERNVIDLWKAKTERPAPLLVFFHGGGFVGGNKTNLDPYLLEICMKEGISVAASNYRYSTQACFPAPMMDSARAIQFIRSKAKDWNIDPTRIAACGDSAGAGISLWIGFHGDLADPKSADPVARESTRLSCMGVFGAQCSYDPRFIREKIGGRAYEHRALPKLYGVAPEEIDSSKLIPMFKAAAPITYVDAGDPPVFMYYGESKEPLPPSKNMGATLLYADYGKNVEGEPKPGAGIHHPKFGALLKEKLDPLGIECVIRLREDYKDDKFPIKRADDDLLGFLRKNLKGEK